MIWQQPGSVPSTAVIIREVDVRTAAEAVVTTRRPSGGSSRCSVNRTSDDAHKEIAAETSRPLGSTTPPRYIAIGVRATRIPSGRALALDQRRIA